MTGGVEHVPAGWDEWHGLVRIFQAVVHSATAVVPAFCCSVLFAHLLSSKCTHSTEKLMYVRK